MARALGQGLIATLVQVFQVNTNSGLVAEGRGSAPWWAIHGRLPAEEGAFLNSYQAQGRWWDLTVVDRVVRWVLLLSVLVLIYTWRMPGVPDRLRALAWMVLAWVVLNAAVTGALANVYDRLQSRVAWLVVLLALLFLQSIPWGRRLFGGPGQGEIARASSTQDRP